MYVEFVCSRICRMNVMCFVKIAEESELRSMEQLRSLHGGGGQARGFLVYRALLRQADFLSSTSTLHLRFEDIQLAVNDRAIVSASFTASFSSSFLLFFLPYLFLPYLFLAPFRSFFLFVSNIPSFRPVSDHFHILSRFC